MWCVAAAAAAVGVAAALAAVGVPHAACGACKAVIRTRLKNIGLYNTVRCIILFKTTMFYSTMMGHGPTNMIAIQFACTSMVTLLHFVGH